MRENLLRPKLALPPNLTLIVFSYLPRYEIGSLGLDPWARDIICNQIGEDEFRVFMTTAFAEEALGYVTNCIHPSWFLPCVGLNRSINVVRGCLYFSQCLCISLPVLLLKLLVQHFGPALVLVVIVLTFSVALGSYFIVRCARTFPNTMAYDSRMVVFPSSARWLPIVSEIGSRGKSYDQIAVRLEELIRSPLPFPRGDGFLDASIDIAVET